MGTTKGGPPGRRLGQWTRTKLPRGTREGRLTVATFRSWRSSSALVARDLARLSLYRGEIPGLAARGGEPPGGPMFHWVGVQSLDCLFSPGAKTSATRAQGTHHRTTSSSRGLWGGSSHWPDRGPGTANAGPSARPGHASPLPSQLGVDSLPGESHYGGE